MKNWQFCMLMGAIYASPLQSQWVNIVAAGVFLILSAIEILRDR